MKLSLRLLLVLAWSAAAYFWLIPLIQPRGRWGWGHYGGRDLLLGAICLLVALVISSAGARAGSRTRRALADVTTAVAATMVAAIACDAAYVFGVRQIWRAPDVWLYRDTEDVLPDDALGFVRKPAIEWSGAAVPGGRYVRYRTDERGFRNPPGIDRADIVFIGDSFTEAGAVPEEDTFARRVAAASALRTVNLGRSHYGAQQEEIVLERYGLAYRPRAVVWVLFEGNDLADADRFAEWRRDPVRRRSLLERYANRSPIVKAVEMTARDDADRPRTLRLPDGGTADVYLDYRYVPDAPVRDALGWRETEQALQAGMELCRSRGIALLIVLVPIKVRVLAPWIVFDDDADRERYLPRGRDTDERDFGHAVGDAGRILGLPVIDTFPLLRARAAVDDRLVFATYQDSHLEVDGHAVLAEAIAAWIGNVQREALAFPVERAGER
jgi:hypothetical protein